MGARSGEVELVCLCHDEDSYSFPKNVDTTSGSSITKIMPYIEKFGYKFMILQHFVDSCDRLRLMSADFERRNICHVREPQMSITLLLSLIYLLSFSGQNMA